MSEAVLVTGCARLQNNPKNASHKSLAWSGRLYGIKGLYSKILLKPRPRVYAGYSVSTCTPGTLLLIVTFPRFSPFRINKLKVDFGNPSVSLPQRLTSASKVFSDPLRTH